MLGHAGQHLAGRDRCVELAGELGVSGRVERIERLLDPDQVVRFEPSTHAQCRGAVPLLIGVDHQRD